MLKNEFSICNMIKSIAQNHADSYTKLFACAKIGIYEHKRSYSLGDQVVVEDGKIMNLPEEIPTHEIIKLEGTLQGTKFRFTLKKLSNHEIKIIDL